MSGGKKDPLQASDEHNARGIELADRGWLDEAVKEFKKAIELDPSSSHAYDNLATIYAEKSQFLDALELYVKAIRLEPTNPNTYQFLASFMASFAERTVDSFFKQAIELDEENSEAMVQYGIALLERGDSESALQMLRQAVELDPDEESSRHELSIALIESRQYAEAIKHLKRITKEYPKHTDAFVDLGIAYTAQGFYAEAESAFFEALRLEESLANAHYYLGSLYTTWGKKELAIEHLRKALEQDQGQVLVWLKEDRLFESIEQDEAFQTLIAQATLNDNAPPST